VGDSQSVGVGQSVGDFCTYSQQFVEWQAASLQTLGQRSSFQKFHHQELDTSLRAHVIQVADMRMRERRKGSGLTLEPAFQF
jgi:hypothetical protein